MEASLWTKESTSDRTCSAYHAQCQDVAATCRNFVQYHSNIISTCFLVGCHMLPCVAMLQNRATSTQLCNVTAEKLDKCRKLREKKREKTSLRAEPQTKSGFLRLSESLPAEPPPSSQVLGCHQKSKLCSALSIWVPSERCQHHGLDAQPMSWWWW